MTSCLLLGRIASGGSTLGYSPLQIVARPQKFSRILLAHCGQLILREKLVNMMPPDVTF